ncbi:hypothetical protein ONZ45_g12956 [Pleurotus djamor]|nr:hypothetical protein ONZ45_g12956 [Pleurotus djamor]
MEALLRYLPRLVEPAMSTNENDVRTRDLNVAGPVFSIVADTLPPPAPRNTNLQNSCSELQRDALEDVHQHLPSGLRSYVEPAIQNIENDMKGDDEGSGEKGEKEVVDPDGDVVISSPAAPAAAGTSAAEPKSSSSPPLMTSPTTDAAVKTPSPPNLKPSTPIKSLKKTSYSPSSC